MYIRVHQLTLTSTSEGRKTRGLNQQTNLTSQTCCGAVWINFRLNFTEISVRIRKMMFDLSHSQPAWDLRNEDEVSSMNPVMGNPVWQIHEN